MNISLNILYFVKLTKSASFRSQLRNYTGGRFDPVHFQETEIYGKNRVENKLFPSITRTVEISVSDNY